MHRFHIKGLRDFVFSYDEKIQAAYIRIKQGRVHKTKEEAPNVFVDTNINGDLIGIEVIDPRHISINIVAKIAREFNVPELKCLNPRAIPDLFACT